jgi:transcriptional regulator with XRE-family HTH domain
MIDRAFGDVVRQVRADAGLSQEALAFAAGLHRTYVSQLERGLKSPSLRTVNAIVDALGIPLSTLFARVEGEMRVLARKPPRG